MNDARGREKESERVCAASFSRSIPIKCGKHTGILVVGGAQLKKRKNQITSNYR